jgi:hypothetical protein
MSEALKLKTGVAEKIHLANNVMLFVTPGVYGKLIALPPLVADHPSKVNPVRVGAVGALEIEPPEVNEPAVTAEPPFEL